MIERPKYLEYRHQRDRIAGFSVKRHIEVKVERPAAALLRLVGKKTNEKRDEYHEEWSLELRTSDVMPDRGALVKTQVTQAVRTVKGQTVPFSDRENPTTEFLNEVVGLTGKLSGHQGSLPSPHLILFPDEPVKKGESWEGKRYELLPVVSPDGQVKSYSANEVSYSGRVDNFGELDSGTEYADLTVSGEGVFGEASGIRQTYTVTGTVRFALREGHVISANISRAMAAVLGETVLTRTAHEQFTFTTQGTEQSVGGMRM